MVGRAKGKTKRVRILVACGSGIATATVAAEAVKQICIEEEIDFYIVKSNIYEIDSNIDNVDLVLTTSKMKRQLKKPSMSVSGLISGVNGDKIRHELVTVLHEIAGGGSN